MARPRQGVTLENAAGVHAYFREALSDYSRADKLLFDPKTSYAAVRALNEINQVQYCNIERYWRAIELADKNPKSQFMVEYATRGHSVPDPDELEGWVLRFVSKDGWKQCQNNLRQARYANDAGREKIQIKLNRSLVSGLKNLAEERGKCLDELLEDFLKKERGY
ncbi:hypothetical protein [Cellvibrio sp. pealriver]|uniref:hypothetical protein n=1 Tax=Cellvibrio sp. pealriver TaxID=1622269 RepID=UPI00066FEBC7|nr:hypothetical protein [Cellvibrio sp. pealriver]